MARRLGAFNAAYLTGRPTPSYPWLSHDWFRSRVAAAEGAIAQLPMVLDHPLVRRAFPGDTAPRVLQFWADRATFFEALDRLPQTFCHLDAYPRNLFVRDHGADDVPIVAIDWAFAGISAIGAELAALVGASLTFDEADLSIARELDHAVFESYLEGLQAAGWRDDRQLVRIGYTAAVALHYIFGGLPYILAGALDESLAADIQTLTGSPAEEFMDRLAILFDFLLDRADEARQLLRSR